MDLTDPEFPHGTNAGYQRGCRNDTECQGEITCRQANRDYSRAYKARKKADATSPADEKTAAAEPQAPDTAPTPDPEPEVTVQPEPEPEAIVAEPVTSPQLDAPTPDATFTALEPTPNPKPVSPALSRRVDAIGSTRRLQGLVFMGYTPLEIAEQTNISVDNIWWLLTHPPATVFDLTHTNIRNRFLRLREQPKTPKTDADHRDVDRARALAADHDWRSPYGYDDFDQTNSAVFYGKPALTSDTEPAEIESVQRSVAILRLQTELDEQTQALAEERRLHKLTTAALEVDRAELARLLGLVGAEGTTADPEADAAALEAAEAALREAREARAQFGDLSRQIESLTAERDEKQAAIDASSVAGGATGDDRKAIADAEITRLQEELVESEAWLEMSRRNYSQIWLAHEKLRADLRIDEQLEKLQLALPDQGVDGVRSVTINLTIGSR